MKSTLKFFLMVLCVSALILNVACSRQDEKKDSQVAKTTMEQSNSNKMIKIGAILPLTGVASMYGAQIKDGMSVAVDHINASGMFSGKFIVNYADSKNSPKDGLSAYRKLKSAIKTPVIVSTMTGVTNAIVPVADQDGVVLFCTSVSASGIAGRSPWVYRLFITADNDAKTMGNYVLSKGFSKVAVLYVQDDFGRSFNEVFQHTIRQKNNAMQLMSESFNKGDIDFRNAIAKIKQFAPDAIYILGYGKNLGIIPKQIREMGLKSQLLSIGTIAQPSVLKQAGRALDGMVYTTVDFLNKDHSSSVSKQFVDDFRSKFNHEPNYFAAFAYDSTMIIAQAIKQYGGSPEAIRDGLSHLNVFHGVTGNISFNEQGDAQFVMDIKTIHVE